jgi:hypothetical protein
MNLDVWQIQGLWVCFLDVLILLGLVILAQGPSGFGGSETVGEGFEYVCYGVCPS